MNKPYSINLLISSGLLFSSNMILADEQINQTKISKTDDKEIALKALTNMSAYLRDLDKFTVIAQLYTDEVMENGQKIKLSKTAILKANPPSSLWAKTSTMYTEREFFFDGKIFTLNSPLLGYYASFDAPDTIGKTLTKASQKYNIELPLTDLFSWGAGADSMADIDEAMIVGIDRVNGISCNQFAFREKDIDWQVCIQRGDTPVPLRLVIISKLEPSQPQFMATLKWDTAPALYNQSYTFTPGSNDHRINFGTVKNNK
ncbi:MAG: DUF2092 domain-containing protein [Gammaproteobacteria bacterium]|nr:DUF2092 domain-containing protein [Gammaproteobacteria bacterium]